MQRFIFSIQESKRLINIYKALYSTVKSEKSTSTKSNTLSGQFESKISHELNEQKNIIDIQIPQIEINLSQQIDLIRQKSQQRHEIPLIPKEPLTPLSSHIKSLIKLTGPITLATFIRQALTSPLGGYYMHNDVFGTDGDFTTSPEISQLFGVNLGNK